MLLNNLIARAPLKDVYKAVVDSIPEETGLRKYLLKSLGSPVRYSMLFLRLTEQIGVYLEDSRFEINDSNARKVPQECAFHAKIGFENVPGEGSEKGYSRSVKTFDSYQRIRSSSRI